MRDRNPNQWAESEKHALTALRATGTPFAQIAVALRRTERGCQEMARNLGLTRPAQNRAQPLVLKADAPTRPCMCCKQAFPSAGPHNRLCGRCRGKENPDHNLAGGWANP